MTHLAHEGTGRSTDRDRQRSRGSGFVVVLAVSYRSDGDFRVPPLNLSINPPEGVPDFVVTETGRSMTTVNSDVRVQIWVARIPQGAVYDIDTGGNVSGYINPNLRRPRQRAGMAALGVRRAVRYRHRGSDLCAVTVGTRAQGGATPSGSGEP